MITDKWTEFKRELSRVRKLFKKSVWIKIAGLLILCSPFVVWADASLPAFTITKGADGGEIYSVKLQILAVMTFLTLLPAVLLTMTSFTRIIVVFAILRQAMGLTQTPSNQILLGLALFLTIFIMSPVFTVVYQDAVEPYLAEKIGVAEVIERTQKPFHAFMLGQTRENDLNLFLDLANHKVDKPEDAPFLVVLPAFVTSELKTAFQIGFMLFIPFLIIDLVVASVLMAMGMVMLSPLIVSLPFKIMLFVLVDGWTLIVGALAGSFNV